VRIRKQAVFAFQRSLSLSSLWIK